MMKEFRRRSLWRGVTAVCLVFSATAIAVVYAVMAALIVSKER